MSGVGGGVGSGGTPSSTAVGGVADAPGEVALAAPSLVALLFAPLPTRGSLEEDVLVSLVVSVQVSVLVGGLVVSVLVSSWPLASGLVLVVVPGAPLCTVLVHWSPERRSSRVGLSYKAKNGS